MRIGKLILALACSAAVALPAFAQTPAPSTAPAPATTPAAPPVTRTPATTATKTSTPAATKTVDPFNINTASQGDLTKLPQIGKVRSAKIIANRPYKSTDELVSKKVISQTIYNKIKDMITL